VKVWKGAADTVRLGVTRDVHVTVPRGRAAELKAAYVIDEAHRAIEAPVEAGAVVGAVTVSLGEEAMLQEPLVTLDGVERGGFFGVFWDSIVLFFLKLFGQA
jgi:D-alanyl-D-alanine carboxypeptidase (penicillin-binding protein 5/6)